jgi:hypothetical protein
MKVRIGHRRIGTVAVAGLAVLAAGAVLGGCLDRPLKPLNPCLVSGVVAEIAVTNIDKVDLLFVVDNSGSMKEEQASLQREFPKLIRTLATGERPPKMPFPPAEDLHLGVVSTDMGLVGIQGIPGCEGLGDDGIMNNIPNATLGGCQATYPRFLTYVAGVHDPDTTASDFTCIAALGTDGCGFEQQLEASLKALWPSIDLDEDGNPREPNRILFLGDAMGFGRLGHGDVENVGFLRNDPTQGISLIAVIVVSDEEDCSSRDTRHFTPELYLDPNNPADAALLMQDLNLRCYFREMADQSLPANQKGLYEPDRYIAGLQALRPGNENLVIFAAIVGVPEDLVNETARANVDFADPVSRMGYYQGILNDPRMMAVPDPSRPPGEGNLTPSCTTANGVAYPPRRFIQTLMDTTDEMGNVRGFGESGVLQSICQDDFGPAMDAIIEVIAKQLGAVCLPRSLVRNSDGMVGCNVVWELPVAGRAPEGTPKQCSDAPFLSVPEKGRQTTDEGGQVCVVHQIAVMDKKTVMTGGITDGWFYDDFSEDVAQDCSSATPQRVAFTDNARPKTGVVVKLECLNETQSLANTRTDLMTGDNVYQPNIGFKCDEVTTKMGTVLMGNEACAVTLKSGAPDPDGTKDGKDTRMFCHPELNVCVLKCATDADCPAAWICDSRGDTTMSAGMPICVNPTCGDIK